MRDDKMGKKNENGHQIKLECTETLKGSKDLIIRNTKVELTTNHENFNEVIIKAKELLNSAEATTLKLGIKYKPQEGNEVI